MLAIISVLYGVFFIISGIEGNAPATAALIGQEGPFLYWIVVLLILLALWDLNVGEELVAVTDVFIEPYCGIDSNMPQVLSGAAQLFGNFALQSVTLGKPGCQYAITVCAATNLNPRLCVGGILPIVKAALM